MKKEVYDYIDGKNPEASPVKILNKVQPNYRLMRAAGKFIDPASETFQNVSASSQEEGYQSPAVATTDGQQMVKRALERAYEKAGINDELIAERHLALLMKNETKYDAKTNTFQETGRPDTLAVKSALDMLFKVRGDYAPEKVITGHMNLNQILESIQNNEVPIVREAKVVSSSTHVAGGDRDSLEAGRPGVEVKQSILDS